MLQFLSPMVFSTETQQRYISPVSVCDRTDLQIPHANFLKKPASSVRNLFQDLRDSNKYLQNSLTSVGNNHRVIVPECVECNIDTTNFL